MPREESFDGGKKGTLESNENKQEREHAIGDTSEELQTLAEEVLAEPPFPPPKNSPKELTGRYEQLVKQHENILSSNKIEQADITLFVKDLAAYNEHCRLPFIDSLRERLNLTAISPKEFEGLLTDLRAPVGKEHIQPGLFNEKQVAYLSLQQVELRGAQNLLLQNIDNALDNLRHGYPLTSDETAGVRAVLIDFLKRRWRLQAEIKRKKPESAPWMIFTGVAFQEILEEAGENSLNFGEQSVFKKWIPKLEQLDTALMTRMNMGAEQAGKILAQRGIPPPKVADVLRSISKMPFGKEFWEKLLTIESPVTIMLFAFYLHSATDKVKAALQFASFLSMSAGTSELLGIAQKIIAKSQYAMRATPLMRSRLTRGSMRTLRFAPKNPAVQFAVMLGVMFGINEILDTYVISPSVEAIPDGDFKHGLGGAISTLSGDAILGHADWALQETGLLDVDPEDEEAYLSQEYLTDTTWNPLNGLDHRFVHTIREWNDKLQSQIDAESKKNPLRAKMWEAHKIDDPQAWAKEKAATELFPLAQYAKTKEREFLAALNEKKDCPEDSKTLRLLSFATADSDEWNKDLGATQYGTGRNDRAIDYVVDNQKLPEGKLLAYVKSLSDKDPVKDLWKEYVAISKQIAKKVALYRSLDIGYSREQWLGDMEHLPDFTKDGFVEAIVHTMKRERAYEFKGTTQDEAITHGRRVGASVKVEKDTVSIASIPSDAMQRLTSGLQATGSNIKKDTFNLRKIITGEQQGAVRSEIRDATSGAYAFGDKRLNGRSSLSNILATAGSLLPPEQQNDVQAEARKLAAGTDIASMDDIRAAHMKIMNAIGEYSDSIVRVEPAGKTIREAMHIAANVPVFFGQSSASLSASPAMKPLQKAFGDTYVRNNDPNPPRSTPRLEPSDVVLFQDITPPQGSRVLSMNVVHCGSESTKDWTVSIHRATYELTRNGERSDRTDTQNISFQEWASRQQSLKDRASPLSKEFIRQQEQAVIRSTKLKIDLAKAQDQKRAAERQSAAFIRTDEKEYTMNYEGRIITYHPPLKSVSAVEKRTGTLRYEPSDPLAFEVQGRDGKKAETVIIKDLRFAQNTALSTDAKRMRLDVLTTPTEGDDRASLSRILSLVAHETYRPNRLMGIAYAPKFYREELLTALLPLYSASPKKKVFLSLLVELLAKENVINAESNRRLLEQLSKKP